MACAHANLGMAADIHTLATIRKVWRIYVFIFSLVDTHIIPVATRAPIPYALEHLLFLGNSWTYVADYAVHAASSL